LLGRTWWYVDVGCFDWLVFGFRRRFGGLVWASVR
jgi:hypothetical protein